MAIASKNYYDLDCIFSTSPLRGYSYGDRWNGWECPYFSDKESNIIMKMAQGFGDIAFKHPKVDAYVIIRDIEDLSNYGYSLKDLENDFEQLKRLAYDMCIGGIEIFEATSIRIASDKVVKLYPIGAYCWVWDKVA